MEPSNSPGAAGELANSGFPDEAFECPNCGQMLAPTCRVCVSCKLPIDPAHVQRKREEAVAAAVVAAEVEAKPEPPPVRFSWLYLLGVVAATWFVAMAAVVLVGVEKAQLVMSGVQLLTAVWVYWDARQKMIRRPLRWAVGTLILWIVIFPWYLARRQKLESPCPFVEAESGPFTRVMLLVIFIVFLAAIILSMLGPSELNPKGGSDSKPLLSSPFKK